MSLKVVLSDTIRVNGACAYWGDNLRACSPYGPMKSAIVVPEEEANIEKNLSMTII